MGRIETVTIQFGKLNISDAYMRPTAPSSSGFEHNSSISTRPKLFRLSFEFTLENFISVACLSLPETSPVLGSLPFEVWSPFHPNLFSNFVPFDFVPPITDIQKPLCAWNLTNSSRHRNLRDRFWFEPEKIRFHRMTKMRRILSGFSESNFPRNTI